MKKLFTITLFLILAVFLISGCQKQGAPATEVATQNNAASTNTNVHITGNMIAKVSDVPSGEIKKFVYNGGEGVLVNFNGDIKAYMNKCTHKGLQLTQGTSPLVDNKIKCPWHSATFSPSSGQYLGTGDQNYGLAGLTMINIKIENGNIYTV